MLSAGLPAGGAGGLEGAIAAILAVVVYYVCWSLKTGIVELDDSEALRAERLHGSRSGEEQVLTKYHIRYSLNS